MISTTDLTGTQLEQLEALLADCTLGGGVYRPPVATDREVLLELVEAELVRNLSDGVFSDVYELTGAGKAIVVDRAMDAAASEAFVRCASKHELRESIERLKAVFNDLTNVELRERTLMDIEACQNRLDDLAEGQSESTGRHRLVPVDDRPTQVIPPVQDAEPMSDREADALAFILSGLAEVEQPSESTEPVQEQTAPMAIAGTLPGVPVVDVLAPEYGEKLLAAIKGELTDDDVFDELVAEQTAEWDALESDLGAEPGWWNRSIVPGGVLVVSVLAAVAVTWFAAWLVMA